VYLVIPHQTSLTHFPYTTLSRSRDGAVHVRQAGLPRGLVRNGLEHLVRAVLQPPLHDGVAAVLADLVREIEGHAVEALRVHVARSEEHTSELQSRENLVCRILLE